MSENNSMDLTRLTDARTILICARLSLRGGKRHLQKGWTATGVAALYDSVLFGMRYYIARHKRCASITGSIELWDGVGLFQALARAGVFEDPLLFNDFSLIVEHALWQGSSRVDVGQILARVEEMLTTLGVMRAHARNEIQNRPRP